ncbi:MAG: hypothetical protein QW215_04690 [Ignisphaera sp.]
MNTMVTLFIAAPMMIAVATILLYNLPWLFRPLKNKVNSIAVSGPVIVVSDVHIGSRKSYYTILGKLLKKIEHSTVIVAGDLLNERVPLNSIVKSLKIALEALDLERSRIIYIISTASHDIDGYFEKPLHLIINGISISMVSGIARILIDDCNSYIYATHGEYVSRDGAVAYFLDRLSVSLFRKSITALVMRRIMGAERATWIFIGHSHIPSIEPSLKVVNTGSWDDRVYAPAKPGIGIIKCVDNRLDVEFIEIPLNASHN